MVIYFFYFIILAYLSFNTKIYRDTSLWHIVVIGLMLFLCFGYMTGSDWRGYELLYNELGANKKSNFTKEQGYVIYNLVFNFLRFDFWPFFILTKCICLYISIYFLRKYTAMKLGWGLFMFFCSYAIAYYIDNPMRNLISSVIYLYAYKYIYQKKFLQYSIVVLIAASFHLSVVLIAPIAYFLGTKKIKKRYIYLVIGIIIIVFILFQEFFKSLVYNLYFLSGIFNLRGINYITPGSQYYQGYFSFGVLARLFLFVIIIQNRKNIAGISKYGELLTNLSIIYIMVYLIALCLPILGRLGMFFYIPYVSCISLLLHNNIIVKHYRYFLILIVVILSYNSMFNRITGDYKYIPYTNYLYYIFDQPTYQYRSEYNYKYSPYYKD
jgi:hypothetical protein